jgi:glycosyltransferase involved in cell wall biosynthesis/2-polyprenyl-3-methyl-5-hydroxy-6-metoxy-1,4-benzoquinol methylase
MLGRPLLIAQLDAMHQSRGGDWFYRTFAPSRTLAQLPSVYVVNVDQAHRRLPLILEQADVLVINGVCSADLLPRLSQRKAASRLTVFEINDDVQSIQASNPLAGFFAQPDNVRLFRRLALASDAVQYSVPELQRIYGSLNARGRVFENQLLSVPPLRDRADGAIMLGWGGSAGHFDDLAELAPELVAFVAAQPSVTLCLMCSDKIWALFDALPASRKRRTPVGSIDDYYRFVSELDIGIAPNRDEGFNRARSDVKFLEYAGFGAVPVVQRLTPYMNSVKHGENGLLFGSQRELLQILSRLVSDPAERRRVRENAYRYVVSERLQGEHATERLAFYDELPSAPAASRAAALFAELSALEGAEVSGRHLVLGHARFERLLYDGLLAMQRGSDRERGASLLRAASELEPDNALPELLLGAELDSEPELRAALAKNPLSVQAALALGSHLLGKKQLKPALQLFLAAAELAPGYEMPFLQAARTMHQLGGAKEAAELEGIAESMASKVAPPPASAPRAAGASGEPAWRLLERAGHLETLSPHYAPTGLLEMMERAPRRVLDVGCFCGGTGRYLKPNCEVVGIEMLEEAGAMAAEVYDRVLVGSLESLDLTAEGVLPGGFDAIIAADVLEHLYNPWQALQRLRPLLARGGSLYVSLPNARNLKLLSELGRGRFDYAGAGILDVTHVRFFTRATAVEMLEQTGFRVTDVRVNPDSRLASAFEGKDLSRTTKIELDGLTLDGLGPQDLLELLALQLYLSATADA